MLINQASTGNNAVNPLVSVIVPSYNSATTIRLCLSSLRAQNTELPFEVIMVDSSDDGTYKIVMDEFPEVRLSHFKERCLVGVARNLGTEKARGEIVLFLDTDCIAPRTWIDRMYTAIKTSGADGVGGSVENGTPWSITGSVGFYLEFFRFLKYDGRPYKTPYLMGGNSGFKREVFRDNRYYNNYDMNKYFGEDYILNWQLLKQGKTILFYPDISLTHMNKTGFSRVLRYQYKLGIGACSYRYKMSGTTLRLLEHCPIISYLLPIAVMPWIGGTVLKRRGLLEFLRFITILPLSLVGNYVWATAFYRELRNGNGRRPLADEQDAGVEMSTASTRGELPDRI